MGGEGGTERGMTETQRQKSTEKSSHRPSFQIGLLAEVKPGRMRARTTLALAGLAIPVLAFVTAQTCTT